MKKNILYILSGLLATNVALAQSDTTHNLKAVEITEDSLSAKHAMLYQPVSVTKLDKVELKRGLGLYLEDAINANVPGVLMERRTESAGQQFNIRGYGNGARGTNGVNSNFDGQGYKVYLNGIPITDAEGITMMDDIDFNSVGDVEVIKGPAGTLYGLAIAGAVNLRTKKLEPGKIAIGQDFMMGSYGLARYNTHIELGGKHSSILINYGHQEYGGHMTHTASHKDFVNVIAEFRPNEKQTITTYLGYSNGRDQRNGELDSTQYADFDYTGNARYIKNDAHSNVVSFRTGFGHTYMFNKHFSNTTTVFGTGLQSDVSSAGGWTDKKPINVGIRSTLDMKFSLSEKIKLTGLIGIESQVQYAQTIGYTMVADSFNLLDYNLIGAMTSNGVTINKTTSTFTEWTLSLPYEIALTAGVGMSTMDIDYRNRLYSTNNNNPWKNKNPVPVHYSARYDGLISPHIALNKVFSKKLSMYISYSKGYKAPTSSMIFIPTTNVVNTKLKPETGTQYEIGSKGLLLNDRLTYQLALFNAIFSDKMTAIAVPNPAKTVTLYTYMVNGGSLDNKGVELLLKYTVYKSSTGFFKSVSPFANMAYSDFKYKDFGIEKVGKDKLGKDSVVRADYSGLAVAGVAPITMNAGIDIASNSGLYMNATWSYRDGMPYTSDGLHVSNSYSLINAKLGFHKEFAKHIDLNVYVGANNITESQYAYIVFLNQIPDAFIPAPYKMTVYGGVNLKYTF